MVTSSEASQRLATCVFRRYLILLTMMIFFNTMLAVSPLLCYRQGLTLSLAFNYFRIVCSPVLICMPYCVKASEEKPPANLHGFKGPVVTVLVPRDFNAVSR